MSADDTGAGGFEEQGFLGPLPLLSPAQCALVLRHDAAGLHAPPLDWNKGRAASDPFFARVAGLPPLLDRLRPLLGPDIVLWGASIVRRGRGQVHDWHTDIETSAPDGRFVSVWIGLENTTRQSGLGLVARSHRLPRTIQEELHRRGLRRGVLDDEGILAIAREIDPEATLEFPPVVNGQAIFFHGRTWHGSRNGHGGAPRSALLLQYAAADTPVRILDSTRLEWPFAFLAEPRPPVVAVCGQLDPAINRPADPLGAEAWPPLGSGVFTPNGIDPSLPPKPWQALPLFSGAAQTVACLTCHTSALAPAHSPHPPHSHLAEELLVVLDGEAELVLADSPDDPAPRRERCRPGTVAYFPAYQHATIRNVGSTPLRYAMLQWHGDPVASDTTLPVRIVQPDGDDAAGAAVRHRLLFEQPTDFLGKLHAHRTTIEPGGGYAAHADPHDIAIIVLSGRVRIVDGGETPTGAEAGAAVFFPAGAVHGMENPGAVPAVYLTFEFHAGITEATGDLVDREWYLATNPDVAAAGIDPVDHYMQFGAAEGRKPRPPVDRPRTLDEMLFNRDWYLVQNPDVATAGLDPFDHYMGFGAGEGRHPCADYHYRLIARSGLFDGDWYRRRYPDAAAFDGDPLRHYLAVDGTQGRAAGPQFDGGAYLRAHADVRQAGLHPLLHYLRFGRAEGRSGTLPGDWNPDPDLARRVDRYRARPAQAQRRIAICTTILGDYDTLTVPDRLDPDIDHVCFADRPIDGYGVWSMRAPPWHHPDTTRMARYIKTHLPVLLAGYEAIVWIDGNVRLLGDARRHVARAVEAGWGIGLVSHPERRCIYAEAERCLELGVDDPAAVDRQMARYRELGIPEDAGLHETNFMVVRPQEPGVVEAFALWWDEIAGFSRRDQLSLGWALRRSGVRHGLLMEPGTSVRNHPDFAYLTHAESRTLQVPRFLTAAPVPA